MAPAAQKKGKNATPKKQQQEEQQKEVVMIEAEEQKSDDAAPPQEASEAPASAPDALKDVAEAVVEEDTPAVEADTDNLEDQAAVVDEAKPIQETATEYMETEDAGDVDEVEDDGEEEEEDAEGAEHDSGDKTVEEEAAMRNEGDGREGNPEAEGNDGGNGNATAEGVSKDIPDDNFGPSSGKIFIGGLSRETTTEVLTRHFEKYGELTDSVIMKNRSTGQPRGFGFVTYADPSIVDRVLQDTHVIDGRTVDAKRTVPREKMSTPSKGHKTKKIFVGGLTSSTTEDDLKAYFGKFGKISSYQIMQDHKLGKSRGFGFVTFDNELVVDEILAQGKMHEIDGKQVEIKKAEPKRPDPPPVHDRNYLGGRRAGAGAGAGPGTGPGPYGANAGFYGGFHAADAPMYGGSGGGGSYFNRGAGRPGGLAYGDSYGYGGGYGAPYGYGEFDEGYGSMNYGHAGYGSGSGYGYGYGGGGGYGSSSRSYGSGRYHPYSR